MMYRRLTAKFINMRKLPGALLLSVLSLATLSTPVVADEAVTLPWYTADNCLCKTQTSDSDQCYNLRSAQYFSPATYDETTEITTLASNGTYGEADYDEAHAYIDAAVNVEAGDYIVMIAFTQASEVRPDNLTGLPYIYGYQMTDGSTIGAYMQGQDTLYFSDEAGLWNLSYGIFPVDSSDITQVRFFMNQGLYNGESYDGATALFKRPGVFVVSSEEAGATLVDDYAAALDPQVVDGVQTETVRRKRAGIAWQPQENADQYIVRVEKPNGDKLSKEIVESDGAPIDESGSAPALTIDGLKPDHEYSVRVRAVVNGEKGDWSDTTAIHTLEATN